MKHFSLLLLWGIGSVFLVLSSCQSSKDQSQNKMTQTAPQDIYPTAGGIIRLDAELDNLLSTEAKIEVLAEGFTWSEGPLWIPQGEYLLFSDVPKNTIHKWKESEGLSTFLTPSGYTGADTKEGETGSNGLVLDAQGRLVLCQHGDRRVARLESSLDDATPDYATIADNYQGQRFNSPNDAVFHPGGDLYFTDPPYGLLGQDEDPDKELDFNGVYRVTAEGEVFLLTDEMTRPNGLAFSPDARTLYVANSDPAMALWMAFDILADGNVANGRVFFDATQWVEDKPGLPDGLKINDEGYIYATGPGGVLIFNPQGKHLGTINTGQKTSNCAFGENGKYLYMTADMYLMRVKLK
ncbi:MAG: SMP-30/gluconolactonase/LRE family protein [Bacteroidetes bacterium]|nr:SMP-30/gluconolactonase/LRE family protein [Bacteroidota bacterium]